jgi:hypothetical protein
MSLHFANVQMLTSAPPLIYGLCLPGYEGEKAQDQSVCVRGLHGPGLVVHIMFGSGPGSGLLQMIAIKSYIEHFGLSRAIIVSQRKVIRSCAHLMLVTQSRT